MQTTLPAAMHRPHPVAGLAVLGVHTLLFWGLLQLDTLHETLRQVTTQMAPLMVRLVSMSPSATTPSPTNLPPMPPAAAPTLRPLEVPAVEPVARSTFVAVDAAPGITPAPGGAPAAAVAAAPVAPPPAATTPLPAPSPATPPAPAPQRLATGALRYLVEPVVVVPRLSRRAGEQGTVLLHVLVDMQGLPKAVTLRQSSGHPRLDEQALTAMRAARFVPCTDRGVPVECEADAPIVYELQP